MTTTQRLTAIKSAFTNPDANKSHIRLQAQQLGTCANRIVDFAGDPRKDINFETEIKVLQLRMDALVEAARKVAAG